MMGLGMNDTEHTNIYILYMLGRCSPLRSSDLFLKNLMVAGGFCTNFGGKC